MFAVITLFVVTVVVFCVLCVVGLSVVMTEPAKPVEQVIVTHECSVCGEHAEFEDECGVPICGPCYVDAYRKSIEIDPLNRNKTQEVTCLNTSDEHRVGER